MNTPQTPIAAATASSGPAPLYITELIKNRRSTVPLSRTIHEILTCTHQHILNNDYAISIYAKVASGGAKPSRTVLDNVKLVSRNEAWQVALGS